MGWPVLRHSACGLRLSLAGGLAGLLALSGAEPTQPRPGASLALLVPLDRDLRRTTGDRPGLRLGLQESWELGRDVDLRLRGEWSRFPQGRDRTASQTILTRVESLGLGAEALMRTKGPLAAGLGLYLLRWEVDSTNRFTPIAGTVVTASGSSRWIRPGFAGLCTWRLEPRMELEGRLLWSRFGYEDHLTATASIGLLWHF